MPDNRFLRGLILVLCAQIPLLGFFVYLLFLGVGISEFSNLADSRHTGSEDIIARFEARENKWKNQISGDVKNVHQKIDQLKKSLVDISASPPAQNNLVFEGASEELTRIKNNLSELEEQFKDIRSSLSDQVLALENKVSSLGQQLSETQETVRSQSAFQNSQMAPSMSTPVDELQKQPLTLTAPEPERKPVAELNFAANDWKLSRSTTRKLNKVINKIRKSVNPVNIGVYGFTVKSGPLNFSMALADKRARVVADLMRDAGLTDNPITIFVVPEYKAYRDRNNKNAGQSSQRNKNHAVHIYIDEK